MKKCIYCDFVNPTEVEVPMFLGDYFLRNLLCEKCDSYHSVCPSCRRDSNLCPDCGSTLIEGKNKIDIFKEALNHNNDSAALEVLTEMQGNINSKLTIHGEGVLHLAVRAGKVQLLKTAIDMGANLQLKNSQGVTPLILARLLGKQNSIKTIERAIHKQNSSTESKD